MVKAKNTLKNKTKTQTKKRTSAQRSKTQARARKQNLRLGTTQKVIIAVIALAFIGVSIAALVVFFCDDKFQVETKINDLATAYYEDYYYPNAFSGNINMSEVLAEYQNTGLTPVSLRQMILSLPDVTEQDAAFLRKYCNENATSVKYYPEPPYEKNSYRTEFTYSCNF